MSEMGRHSNEGKKCAHSSCSALARTKGWCHRHYGRIHRHGSPDVLLQVGQKGRQFTEEEILHVLSLSHKPIGAGKIRQRITGTSTKNYCGNLSSLLDKMYKEEKIEISPGHGGIRYFIEKDTKVQYTVSARVPQERGETRNSIETDLRQRAIHLGNVFRNNGWNDVKIEVQGKEYKFPWGDLP